MDKDNLPMDGQPKTRGVKLIDILKNLPEDQRSLVNWIMRQGDCSLSDVIEHFGDEELAHKLLNSLLEQGYVEEISKENDSRFKIQLPPRRQRKVPSKLLKALSKKKQNQ